jgi:hypothetical protein
MDHELTPKWGIRLCWFVIPDDKGIWHVVPGDAEVIDGTYHKLRFPGFETRSGESFGVTATFHVLDALDQEATQCYGPVRKIVLQNGRITSSEVVGMREPIVGVLSAIDAPPDPIEPIDL